MKRKPFSILLKDVRSFDVDRVDAAKLAMATHQLWQQNHESENFKEPPATPPDWICDFGSAIGVSGNSNGTAMGLNHWVTTSAGTSVSEDHGIVAPADRDKPCLFYENHTGRTWIWRPDVQRWEVLNANPAPAYPPEYGANPGYPAQQYDPAPGSLAGQWGFHVGEKQEPTPPLPKREEPKVVPITRGKRVFRLD